MKASMSVMMELICSLDSDCLAGGFGLNTDLLETNLINLAVVIGILVYFGNEVLNTLLTNRRETILSTIRDTEERYQKATDKLNQSRARLEQARSRADQIRVNGLSQMERGRQELIRAADGDSKRLEDSKNATLRFEQQRAIEQVRQQVSRLALERALELLNSRLSADLQSCMIDYHIGLLKTMKGTLG